jgi:hypothetical protein
MFLLFISTFGLFNVFNLVSKPNSLTVRKKLFFYFAQKKSFSPLKMHIYINFPLKSYQNTYQRKTALIEKKRKERLYFYIPQIGNCILGFHILNVVIEDSIMELYLILHCFFTNVGRKGTETFYLTLVSEEKNMK